MRFLLLLFSQVRLVRTSGCFSHSLMHSRLFFSFRLFFFCQSRWKRRHSTCIKCLSGYVFRAVVILLCRQQHIYLGFVLVGINFKVESKSREVAFGRRNAGCVRAMSTKEKSNGESGNKFTLGTYLYIYTRICLQWRRRCCVNSFALSSSPCPIPFGISLPHSPFIYVYNCTGTVEYVVFVRRPGIVPSLTRTKGHMERIYTHIIHKLWGWKNKRSDRMSAIEQKQQNRHKRREAAERNVTVFDKIRR